MELITLTPENLDKEHICCAISNNKDCQVAAKKAWLKEQMEHGLVFTKGDVRGKCFIEYIPAQYAWAPIHAKGYMYIDCFWVSGQFKGQGNANLLLDSCIADCHAKGYQGLCVLSSAKKQPFLSDPAYLAHKGFMVADHAEPYFTLLYLPFSSDAPVPSFESRVKKPHIDEAGFVLYYTHQCPYTAKYVPLLEAVARDNGVAFRAVRFTSAKEAQAAPAACTSYCLFYNGDFITQEILSESKFQKLIEQLTGSAKAK